jgi:predicted kinase
VSGRAPAGPCLYIFSGLPGSGKSTLAKELAGWLKAAYLRIDTIEQALRELCSIEVEAEGYRLAYRLAADNLRSGVSVVADSCNPIDLTRREWEQVAVDAGVPYVNVEVVCSDPEEHRRRVESRTSSIAGLRLPTWPEVEGRATPRVVVDTAGASEAESYERLRARLGLRAG